MVRQARIAGAYLVQQAIILAEHKHVLAHISILRDRAIPVLVGTAVEALVERYRTGGTRNPQRAVWKKGIRTSNQSVLVRPQTRIDLQQIATTEQCNVADLVREAVADLIAQSVATVQLPPVEKSD